MKQTSRKSSGRNGSFVRAGLALASGASIVFGASMASAQQRAGDFGQQGEFIIDGNRLFQLFAFDNVSQGSLTGVGGDVTSITNSSTSTTISLLYGSNGNSTQNGTSGDPFFTVPRVGFDYVIVPNVTIGGDLIVLFTLGGHSTVETDTSDGKSASVTSPNPGVTGFGIAPRGGYILPLSDMFSLWLRGGFSYYTATSKISTTNAAGVTTTDSTNIDQFALDLEPQIVFHPIPHVGFTAGLTADIPLTGGISGTTTTGGDSATASAHSSIFYLGIELGMLAHF
jgi:hypothetical protein